MAHQAITSRVFFGWLRALYSATLTCSGRLSLVGAGMRRAHRRPRPGADRAVIVPGCLRRRLLPGAVQTEPLARAAIAWPAQRGQAHGSADMIQSWFRLWRPTVTDKGHGQTGADWVSSYALQKPAQRAGACLLIRRASPSLSLVRRGHADAIYIPLF